MKAIEQYLHVVLFIMLLIQGGSKLKSVYATLVSDHSNHKEVRQDDKFLLCIIQMFNRYYLGRTRRLSLLRLWISARQSKRFI